MTSSVIEDAWAWHKSHRFGCTLLRSDLRFSMVALSSLLQVQEVGWEEESARSPPPHSELEFLKSLWGLGTEDE
jgi:hypothetical protein